MHFETWFHELQQLIGQIGQFGTLAFFECNMGVKTIVFYLLLIKIDTKQSVIYIGACHMIFAQQNQLIENLPAQINTKRTV